MHKSLKTIALKQKLKKLDIMCIAEPTFEEKVAT